jgi:DNA mismatch endonuclease (patch repair protein)
MAKGTWIRTDEFREAQRQRALQVYERKLTLTGSKVDYITPEYRTNLSAGVRKAWKEGRRKGGWKCSEEHNRSISLALKGKPKSEEHKAKLRGPRTEEEKLHMREAALNRTEEQKQQRNTRYQISLDLNGGRERISAANKGIKRSETTRALIVVNRAKLKFPYNNSKPEVKTQEYLRSINVSFETHKRLEFYRLHTYDIVITDRKVIVEVDGCYWHGCPQHYPENLDEQKERDLLHTSIAEQNGWKVIRIWEHEINSGDFSKLIALMEGRNG